MLAMYLSGDLVESESSNFEKVYIAPSSLSSDANPSASHPAQQPAKATSGKHAPIDIGEKLLL